MSGPSELAACAWGNIRLFASQVQTDSGRTQVVHELSSGDDHPVQNRGLRVRRVRVRLQFDDFPGQPSPRDAALALERAKDTGEVAIFRHPLLGSFTASIGDFNSEIDENSVISADAEFIKESRDVAVTPAGFASSSASGESLVSAAAATADVELAKVDKLKVSGSFAGRLLSRISRGVSFTGTFSRSLAIDNSVRLSASLGGAIASNVTTAIRAHKSISTGPGRSSSLSLELADRDPETVTSTVQPITDDPSAALASAASEDAANGMFAMTTIDARVAVAVWSDGDISTRQILIDAARISNNIAVMIEVGGFESDLALWPAFRSVIMLGESIRAAAIAATSETPAVFVMRIIQPTALLPLAARIYGGASAAERARQITELNDISTPGWIPPGDYLMPIRRQ